MRALFLLLLLALAAAANAAQERLAFIGVALDLETRQADTKLRNYLARHAGVTFAQEELEYERVVDRLIGLENSDGAYVARVTPYVYLVAEMLGAKFEPLATYLSSATDSRTYHAYLVVNKKDFPAAPTLFDVVHFLKRKAAAKDRARFIYHSRFSTSSYFVSTLYLHAQNVFHMPESTESLTAISSQRIEENSSSKLVELVAQGKAELAAVWDGTKKKYEAGGSGYEAFGREVHFVQLPTAMPNDFLICSASLDARTKEGLRAAVRQMSPDEITVGDFRTWHNIQDTMDARQALADLRWLARERVPPATVEIALHPRARASRTAATLVEAARQAVRLSGTELVLFDDDFHVHIDFDWTLEPIHDGAVLLRSRVKGAGVDAQDFRISFRDTEDLTRRIVSITQSRLHRIRYVWAYSSAPPTIIRDIAFSIPRKTPIKLQRISWLDPERNKFLAGPMFNARVQESGFYRYDLDAEDFARAGETVTAFDPLSNVSYRAFLLRPSEERGLFKTLTYVLLALFVLSAAAAVWDVSRRR